MARFERISLDPIGWEKVLSAFPDRVVFQSPAWLSFLAETQKAEPVFAALKEEGNILGYFSALIMQRCGLRILGSPFRGWSSPYMGFNLFPTTPRRIAAQALSDFAFKDLGCIHFEVVDSHMTLNEIEGLGLTHEIYPTMEIDLSQSEETLFGNMSSSCRRNIRHAEKHGVIIEEASDEQFAEDFSAQFKDVFAKQGLIPHFGADRVRVLIKHVHPTGMLLLLRARDPEGRCIATGVFPAMNQTAFYWGGTSWRQYQKLYPNELLQWYAIRYWKKRGIGNYNMVGNKEFKRRFGGRTTTVAMIRKSKYHLVSFLRSSAPQFVRRAQRLARRVNTLAGENPAGHSLFEFARVSRGRTAKGSALLRLYHGVVKAAVQKALSVLPGGSAAKRKGALRGEI